MLKEQHNDKCMNFLFCLKFFFPREKRAFAVHMLGIKKKRKKN